MTHAQHSGAGPARGGPAGDTAVSLRDVSKSYGPVKVLDIPGLDLVRGQIVAVVGENGAGKSTLMGVLSGTVTPTTGTIGITGQPLQPGRPDHSQELGVALVAQEFPLVGQLSVAENLLLGRRPATAARRLLGSVVVDRAGTRAEARALLAEVGVTGVDVDRPVERFPVPVRQMIEIAKAWGHRPVVLILDEPTSSLGPVEAGRVLDLARAHARAGGAVLFIGHRLDEVRAIADRVLVLRSGRLVADLTPAEATEERMIREMVGADLARADLTPPSSVERSTTLAVRGLTADGLGPVDLDVRAGEIVGVAGLMGSGRSRLLHTVMGAQPRTGGDVAFEGADFRPRHPADAVRAGIGLVPEDRKVQALLPAHSVRWNVTLATLRRISSRGVLRPRTDRAHAARIVADLGVRLHSQEQPIGDLSGGNQQKAVFGRWLATRPRLLLLDEPTRGVDVGAKAEIYRLIDAAAQDGLAVLVASSELEELLWICHRIVVMAHGRVVADIPRERFGKEVIMTAAAGTTAGAATRGKASA
ncbi:sugar ABC transporter ATP-binding protein [Actinacidiphila rubida]|uniref:Ribose transport system ATP-binding protein/rhamnose transport system ATP-binding protein n=1 Tax=Actinacidiphila rubida TaxID=310780 RepID=A0A1H8V516_9ACTN|nr:sugar ABC transporter ATP-binding protein [Actinacidiphila rubida]SEP10506.1 ribose transport system ATP-binding protein/rhamnose transport system ATP-binding protein [Actinacidiphila rubida]